jgi:hypothetical protein
MCCHVCFISAKINVYYFFCFIIKPNNYLISYLIRSAVFPTNKTDRDKTQKQQNFIKSALYVKNSTDIIQYVYVVIHAEIIREGEWVNFCG